MKAKPHTLLLAAGIAALGIYCYPSHSVAPSAPASPASDNSPMRTSTQFAAPAEEAPSRSPESKITTEAQLQDPKSLVSRPAPIEKRNVTPVIGTIAALPAGRRSGTAPAPKVEVVVPPAVRLSEKFRLPAGIMAQAMPIPEAGKTNSPQVRAAAERIVSQFYQEISYQVMLPADGKKEPAQNDPAKPDEPATLEPSPPPDEVATNKSAVADTVMVEPDTSTDQIRWNADEGYRILFGDESYNQQTMRSAIEVTLPEIR